MRLPRECTENIDKLKLVREGTSQEGRLTAALDPASAPVDERGVAHRMVFAQAYAAFLKYFDLKNTSSADWKPFFSNDPSVQLAVAAVQDLEFYKATVKEYFDVLRDLSSLSDEQKAKDYLGFLFSYVGTIATQFDELKVGLPPDFPLKAQLKNLIQGQLAPALRRLISYYKADAELPAADRLISDVQPNQTILGTTTIPFSRLLQTGLSEDWQTEKAADWKAYTDAIDADDSPYGSGATAAQRINHLATHNLFTAVFDHFLKAFARTVGDAGSALEATFTGWDLHQPHYTLFLAFLRLFEYARARTNTFTARHLDFYYRDILQLKEKPAQPGRAHLLVELASQAAPHLLQGGVLFKAGKDDLGLDAFFANDADLVANQAKVADLKKLYRHGDELVGSSGSDTDSGRIFAAPVANSDDGLGAPLSAPDQSWHPFYNKVYRGGILAEIAMPKAEIGFAVASHYLYLTEGTRTVTVTFSSAASGARPSILAGGREEGRQPADGGKEERRRRPQGSDFRDDIACRLTSEKGWLEASVTSLVLEDGSLTLLFTLSGSQPAVVPYLEETHGYRFATALPVLLVTLRHRDSAHYLYEKLQEMELSEVGVMVDVQGVKSVAATNDFGPVDTSKPFQPFGAQPVNGAGFTVGSKELFQKTVDSAGLLFDWQNSPTYYASTTPNVTSTAPTVGISTLQGGEWSFPTGTFDFNSAYYNLVDAAQGTAVDSPDFSPNEPYAVTSRNGYVRLVLKGDLGFRQYQVDLANFLAKIDPKPTSNPGAPILGPFAKAVSLSYKATQTIPLYSSAAQEGEGAAAFFHVGPFGVSEERPALKSRRKVYLLPQFDFRRDNALQESAAEFYIGVSDLAPPQNLALLFQVADGTADPLSPKPHPHLNWSYLREDDWVPFPRHDVVDDTGELLRSGIITFAMPADATTENTMLPAGLHWIRCAVATRPEAVCRLILVAAQALEATFADRGNDPAFPATVLPAGTIAKLDEPEAEVKGITQPFPSFGGRGKEAPGAFYTRISERLRHKDRAVALYDYERLILEAFPQIYRVKCLNHTQYGPDASGRSVYKEVAPGHVTVVTVPNQQYHNLRDPLQPYTSLSVLEQIADFLRPRLSCFVQLHVKNPLFEEVQVACKVRLREGFDESFYVGRLQEEITRFLSPWAFPGGGTPSFGGRIYKSVLINFVEDLPYVDYVTDFLLWHSFNAPDGAKREEGEEVAASKAVSILVSARSHVIEVLHPAADEAAGEICPCQL